MEELIELMQRSATALYRTNNEADYDLAREIDAKISDLREYGYVLYVP